MVFTSKWKVIQFGVNYMYLAHFPLLNMLLDHLKEAQATRDHNCKFMLPHNFTNSDQLG